MGYEGRIDQQEAMGAFKSLGNLKYGLGKDTGY